jgi:energy-coupling factor transporter ATP-binding protein EcfA2
MKYNYFLGGITIASDIYYPELLLSPYTPNAHLYYGDVPEHLEDNNVDFPFIEANQNQYLLKLPRLGRYLVQNGDTIVIQKNGEMLARDFEKQVLTSPLGVLSYQRGFVPFHGGAFIHEGKAVLLSGKSGSGKSSILTSLHRLGYTVISDDISNIKVVDGKAMIYPSFPRIMIWKEMANLVGLDTSGMEKLRSDMEKYFYPTSSTIPIEPVEIEKIIFVTGDQSLAGTTIMGLNKVLLLRQNVFHPWMVQAFNKQIPVSKEILSLSSVVKALYAYNNSLTNIQSVISTVIKNLSNA